MRIVIVGGGIGGVALAASLRRVGLSALVLEQAPQLGEVGSGLGVLPGAVRALHAIGVSPSLFEEAAPLEWMHISNHRGKDLSSMNLTELFFSLGERGYIMRRSSLHSAIAACVEPEKLQTNARVTDIKELSSHVELTVEGRSEKIEADLVIGADGLRSVIRGALLGEQQPRYAGETILRAISAHPTAPHSREIFGDGQRLGYYNIGNGQTYYWATSQMPAGSHIPPQERKAFLAQRFAGWPFDIPQLIEETPEDKILQNDIFDRPPVSSWHRGRVVLLGDAAHPTTPNMGQGACMAIEDAVVLARAISQHKNIESAFIEYEAARVSRTKMITNLSKLWGHVGLWRAAPLAWLRDGFYRFTPDAVFLKILQDQYSYDPGAL